ncbi:hypothetical protein [Pseudomonas hamedanensis]|uniref:Uncharacterized protein n=1 Tax=Pseudomonas hamedanensis TaxID=2745504 RepID=A0A9E6TG91_9PSED|nr:hypothetical protein [Pseudomonas hamedanensis]QXI17210.1 hypothetical protein HU739_025555 [Pseudomonas hamedanensis]
MDKNNNGSFTANLYVNGLPVVLNQQRLKLKLRDPRITRRVQLEAETGLADKRASRLITLADHEDDKPLLFTFTAQGDSYAITVSLRGIYDQARLVIEPGTHDLLVSTTERSEFFSISKMGVLRATLIDFETGPAYIDLATESNQIPLYKTVINGMSVFKNVDPNLTGHTAFNNKPVIFVMKIIDKLPLSA